MDGGGSSLLRGDGTRFATSMGATHTPDGRPVNDFRARVGGDGFGATSLGVGSSGGEYQPHRDGGGGGEFSSALPSGGIVQNGSTSNIYGASAGALPIPPTAIPGGGGELSMFPAGDNIRALIQSKEKELHDINEYRIRTLEQLLREKERTEGDVKAQLGKLQEDFKYNLKLIEDRDRELEKYDETFANFKNVVREKDSQISELQVHVADAQSMSQQESSKGKEQEAYFQGKIKELREQLEGERWTKDDESRRQREEFEAAKREMQRQMRDKDEDMETLKREITATFDEVMRQRETEFKTREEALSNQVRELDSKSKANERNANSSGTQLQQAQKQLVEAETRVREVHNTCSVWSLCHLHEEGGGAEMLMG